MKPSHRLTIFLVCAALFHVGLWAHGAQAQTELNVSIDNGGYAPQVTRVPAGTIVTWTNNEGVHTTTSRDGLWDSGVLTVGDSFTYLFDTVGIYRYYDTIHGWPSGTIEVVHSLATIDIATDKDLYAAGDTIKVGVHIANPGAAVRAGIYVWSKAPSGDVTWFLRKTSVLLPAGYVFDDDEWFTATLPALRRGEYLFGAALVKVPEQALIDLDRAHCDFGEAIQSDWSGGPVAAGPIPFFDDAFDSSGGVSWRSLPGRLSLSAQPRTTPIERVIAVDAGIPVAVAAGDLNGDGQDEVISADPVYDIYNDLGAIYWWERLPDDRWVQHTVSDDFYGAHKLNRADVDSDGDLDVLCAAYYGDDPGLGIDGRYAWFENLHGDGSAWKQHLVGTYFHGADHIDAGDFDGDGDIDIVGTSELTDGIDEQESDLTWFENLDGKGTEWGQHDLDLDFPNASEAYPVDLDSDGDLDIVGAYSDSYGPSQFAWWENVEGNGTTWTKHWIPYTFWGAGYLDVGDIDNDGDPDLLGGGYNTSAVGFWENLDGLGQSWTAWSVTSNPGGRGAELSDIDGDGDLDALLWNTYFLIWMDNLDGQGFNWDLHLLSLDLEDPWATAADVNNDGKLEIVACSEEYSWSGEPQLLLYDVTRFATSGELTSAILDGGLNPGWEAMMWNVDVPSNTALSVELRASNDASNMGLFQGMPHSGVDLGTLIDPNSRYLQYRVTLTSSDPDLSPILRDLTIEKGSGL